jgi:hypothetical protein
VAAIIGVVLIFNMLERAVSLDGETLLYQNNLATLYQGLHKYPDALKIFQQTIE